MNRLDKMILGEIVAPFILCVLLFTGLFMGVDDFQKIIGYALQGVSPMILLQFFLLALPPIVSLTSPMGMLLAALLGFGRLSGDSELTALSAAGIPLERVLAPVAAFAFVVSCVGAWINDTVIPSSARQRQAIIDDQKRANHQSVGSQIFTYRQADDRGHVAVLIHAEGPLSTIGGGRVKLEDVTVTRYQNGEPQDVLYAPVAEGMLDSADWQLPDGFTGFGRAANGTPYKYGGAAGSTQRTTLATPEALLTAARPNEELTTPQLREKARVLRASHDESSARGVEVEMAKRYALPFSSLIFALVGAPLGITPRRAGKGLGFGYSVLITILYWIALQAASLLGQMGALPPVVAVWLPNVIGMATAAYLILQARR